MTTDKKILEFATDIFALAYIMEIIIDKNLGKEAIDKVVNIADKMEVSISDFPINSDTIDDFLDFLAAKY